MYLFQVMLHTLTLSKFLIILSVIKVAVHTASYGVKNNVEHINRGRISTLNTISTDEESQTESMREEKGKGRPPTSEDNDLVTYFKFADISGNGGTYIGDKDSQRYHESLATDWLPLLATSDRTNNTMHSILGAIINETPHQLNKEPCQMKQDQHTNASIGTLGFNSEQGHGDSVPVNESLFRRRRGTMWLTETEEVNMFVTESILSNVTQTFLATFEEPIQRETVRLQLQACPLVELCTFSLDIDKTAPPHMRLDLIHCCEPCYCILSFCMERSNCCPDLVPSKYFRIRDEEPYNITATLSPRPVTENDVNVNGNAASNDDFLENMFSPKFQCTLGHAKHGDSVDQHSWIMISTCSSLTNQTLVAMCEQDYLIGTVSTLEDIVPVTESPFGHTYRNKYCALCNAITCTSCLQSWDILMSCDDLGIDFDIQNNLIDYVFETQQCEMTFKPRESDTTFPPLPCTTSISKCNVTGNWEVYDPVVERQCLLYGSVFSKRANGTLYFFHNAFCALCNGVSIEEVECAVPGTVSSVPFAFTGLLTFESYATFDDPETKSPNADTSACSAADEVYDPLTDSCIMTHCPRFHIKKNGECVLLVGNFTHGKYSTHIILQPNDRINLHNVSMMTQGIRQQLEDHIFQILWGVDYYWYIVSDSFIVFYTLNESIHYEHLQSNRQSLNVSVDRIHIKILFVVTGDHDVHVLHDNLKTVNGELWNFYDRFYTAETVSFSLYVENDNAVFSELETLTRSFPLPPGENLFLHLPKEEVKRLSYLTGLSSTIVPYLPEYGYYYENDHNMYLDLTTMFKCSLIKFFLHEVRWEKHGQNIYIDIQGIDWIVLSFVQYFHDVQNLTAVYVCLEDYLQLLEQSSVYASRVSSPLVESDVEIIVSIICICLSLLSLVITVIVYVIVPPLRTVPGLNIICLSVSLIAAQSLYLLSAFGRFEQASSACVTVGLMMHLIWLVAIFWMSSCTIHMFRVLTSTQQMTASLKPHILYHVYSMTAALVFVFINIGISLARSDGSDIGYGAATCYFSVEDMLNYTFALPVLVVVLKNLILFAIVAVTLRRQNIVRKHVKNERNDLVIFTKLSTLTGTTWLVGFLYTWTTIEAMSYAFIVLNATQGMFIMLSFATNKRVYQIYKKSEGLSSKYSTKQTFTYN